jgi:hypothetical protein
MLFLKKLVDDHLHAPEIEVAKKVRIILLCFVHSQHSELLFRVRVCACVVCVFSCCARRTQKKLV